MRRRSYALAKHAEFHKWEIFAIEDEIPPDPDWEAKWYSDNLERQSPPQRRFYSPGWSPPSEDDPSQIIQWRKSQERRIAFHEKMSRKYEYASARPWLAVEPDPPKPE